MPKMPIEYQLPKPADFDDDEKKAPVNWAPIWTVICVVCVAALVGIAAEVAYREPADGGKFGQNAAENREFALLRQRFNLCIRAHDLNGALKIATLMIPYEPNLGHRLRAQLCFELQRYPEAIESYSFVLAFKPNDPELLNNRAYARALAQLDLEEALDDIENALATDPENESYIDTRGYLHYLLGDQKKALTDINQAMEMLRQSQGFEQYNPGVGEVVYHRALIYDEMDQPTEAAADYALAKKLGFKKPDKAPLPVETAKAKGDQPQPAPQAKAPAEAIPKMLPAPAGKAP